MKKLILPFLFLGIGSVYAQDNPVATGTSAPVPATGAAPTQVPVVGEATAAKAREKALKTQAENEARERDILKAREKAEKAHQKSVKALQKTEKKLKALQKRTDRIAKSEKTIKKYEAKIAKTQRNLEKETKRLDGLSGEELEKQSKRVERLKDNLDDYNDDLKDEKKRLEKLKD